METIEKTQDDTALMIDLETLALGPDAYVTQVGLCVADTRTREYLVSGKCFWLTHVGQEQRVIDPDTVRWWMGQDPKVVASVFAPVPGEARSTPQEVFDYIKQMTDATPMTVWASPAMFDLSMLTHLWGGKKPWKYSQERDMMTLYKLVDPEGKLRPANNGMGHNAMADARWQMDYLFRLLDNLRDGAGPAEWAMKLSRIPGDA